MELQTEKPEGRKQMGLVEEDSASRRPGCFGAPRMVKIIQRHPGQFWAIAIAVAFFAINFTQIGRYGLSFDEAAGMERGRQTLALVGGLFQPAHEQNGGQDFAAVWLHNHPSFYATCNYGLAHVLTKDFGWRPVSADHFLNLLVASAGLVALFNLGQLLFNARVGLLAELFMVFFPRFIANAHYNAKDVPMMMLGTLALFLLNLAARRSLTRYWILAGLMLALAITTKLDGLFVLPIFLIPWLVKSLCSEKRFSGLGKIGISIGVSVVFIFLCWPQLWKEPLHLFNSIANFAGPFRTTGMLYLGRSYPLNHLPWHYIPLNLIAVTPLILLAAMCAGAVRSLPSLLHRQNAFEHGLLWCWVLLPVLPRLWPGIVKYDGMRHVFLIVPALAILAGFGVDRLLAYWKGRAGYRLMPAAVCGAIVWSGWQVIECHPYEGFYLNEVVRAVVPAPKLAEDFDFSGWGSLYTQGVEWLNAHAPLQSTVALGDSFAKLGDYGPRTDLKQTWDVDKADYVLAGCWNADITAAVHVPPVFSARCYGTDLFCVYAQHGNLR